MTISVVIPTLNEETEIGETLERLAALGPDEIVVSDGGSSDRTVAIARSRALVVQGAVGRGPQLNAGVKATNGDVLLFLHADVRLCGAALRAIREVLRDQRVVGGGFDIRYEGGWEARAFTRINRWRRRLGILYGDS